MYVEKLIRQEQHCHYVGDFVWEEEEQSYQARDSKTKYGPGCLKHIKYLTPNLFYMLRSKTTQAQQATFLRVVLYKYDQTIHLFVQLSCNVTEQLFQKC